MYEDRFGESPASTQIITEAIIVKEIVQRSLRKALQGEDILGEDRLTLLLLDGRVQDGSVSRWRK